MNKCLIKMYREFCDTQERCEDCQLNKTSSMLESAYQQGKKDGKEEIREEVIDECLHAIGGVFSLDWEYCRGVEDCYNTIKQLKDKEQ